MTTVEPETLPSGKPHSLARAVSARVSVCVLLATVIGIGILTLPATIYGGDPVAWQAEAKSIVINGELNIPPSLAINYGEPGQFFVLNHKNGKYYSKYGTLNGILNVVPLLVGYLIDNPVLSLGLFAVILSAIIAYVLYDLAGFYTNQEWVKVAFVLLCFYATYAWNYLRGTNSEPTQWLFFVLAVRALFRLNRVWEGEKHYLHLRAIAPLWVWTACLCLTKVSWVLLIPVLSGSLIYLARRQGIPRSRLPGLFLRTVILPAMLICAVVAANNWAKFGAPWLSGYHQWDDPDPKVDFIAASYDLILSPQWSLLLSFPPVLLAIPGWKRFWREHKEQVMFILAVFVLYLFVNILRGNWRGEGCYGPRYFLFILPMLALPAIYTLEWAAKHKLALAGILATGLFFAAVQWQVNRLEWFFKYHIEGDLFSLKDPQVHGYFKHTHYAKISWDYWQARHDLTKIPYYDRIRAGLSPEQMQDFLSGAQDELSHPNLYWWRPF